MNGNLAYDWATERTPRDLSHAFPAPSQPGLWQDSRPSHITIAPTRLQRKARPRVIYALIAAVGIFGIIASQLLLSVATSQAAYEIAALEGEATTLSRTWQSLTVELDSVASPQNLAAHAESLGMVRNTNPSVFLRLSDGAVLGHPAAANATAGSVIGAGDMVPNSLLTPKNTQSQKAKAAAKKTNADSPAAGAAAGTAVIGVNPPTAPTPTVGIDLPKTSAPDTASAGSLVPLQGGLPSPKTH